MKTKQFEVPGLAQYSYALSSEGNAIVIDPMRDFDRCTKYAIEQGVAIKYVTETHIHADFSSCALALAVWRRAHSGCAEYRRRPKTFRSGQAGSWIWNNGSF